MRTQIVIGALAGAGLLWAGVAAEQETRATPGFGSGIVKVAGTVDVGNEPVVHAAQRGEWRVDIAGTAAVRVANTPTVLVGGPAFVRKDGRYAIVWTTGENEKITVAEVATGGWVEVRQAGGLKRWINLSSARSIEQAD